MDKAGPSGDYDGSNTSVRDSKTSTMIMEEVYDVNQNCLNKLNSIRRSLNLQEFKEYRECLPSAYIDHWRNDHCTITITEGPRFSSEQTSPNSTFCHATVNNNLRSTTSFNLVKDFQQNSPYSRPDTATSENSSNYNNPDHFFICAHNTDFTNPNNNGSHSKSSIDPFTSAEFRLDLTESLAASNSVTPSPASPFLNTTYLSGEDVETGYELSSGELRKVGALNNWSASYGKSHRGDSAPVSARCLEIPPKRMRIQLDTSRFPGPPSSPSNQLLPEAQAAIELKDVQSGGRSPNDVRKSAQVRNYEFRGCLSAVDGRCESLANPEPRTCKSHQNSQEFPPVIFREISEETPTVYLDTSSGESFNQICKEIQQNCANLLSEEESRKSFPLKSSADISNFPCQNEIQVNESKLMVASRYSEVSLTSKSTTSYEIEEASKSPSYLIRSHRSNRKTSYDHLSSGSKCNTQRQECSAHPSCTTVNSLIEDFKDDFCINCQSPQFDQLDDHCSFSRHTTASQKCASENIQSLKINIPSSVEDNEFANGNSSRLEPNIITVDSPKYHHQSKFRFWRFKRRKDRLGSGDSSATSNLSTGAYSESLTSKSSVSYIISPAGIEVDNKLKMQMITSCETPDSKPMRPGQRTKSKESVNLEEEEICRTDYSDLCLPIKSLEKLPDEKSVKDVLQSMSQSIFKKHSVPAAEAVDSSISDCSDVKEDLILSKFSSYSQFKTRAELLAEHVIETEKERDEMMKLSKVIKGPNYQLPPSSSDDSSETSYYLNRRKPQNTQIRFYEIPSPANSNSNVNQEEDGEDEEEEEDDDDDSCDCKYERECTKDTVLKIDDEDDDINSGFCGNCFCKNIIFPKLSRSYFV